MLTHMLGIRYQTGWEQNAARFPPQLSADPAVCSVPAAHASTLPLQPRHQFVQVPGARKHHEKHMHPCFFFFFQGTFPSSLSPTSLLCPAPLLSVLTSRTLQAGFLLSRKSKWSSEGCTWKSPSLK